MDLYVDSINGDDTSGSNLFKTLDYCLNYIATLSDAIYNINLADGSYTITLHDNLFSSNKNISIKGTGLNTIITQTQGFYYNTGGGNSSFTLNINKLIYKMIAIQENYNMFKFNWNFNNVVFLDISNVSYAIFLPFNGTNSLNIIHCIKNTNSTGFLRTTNGIIKVSNSYGAFTSGYGTSSSNWDDGSNIIIASPQLDSNYKILNADNDLYGVYSGSYTWNNKKFLIKQGTSYYSIKPEFYSQDTDSYDPQLISELSGDKFSNYGIDDLTQIHNNALNKLITNKYQIAMLKSK